METSCLAAILPLGTIKGNVIPENTHLLFKGKYHCMDNLLFVLFGFSCFAHDESVTYLLVWLNPNQSNKRSAVQCYFQLQSKQVFSGYSNWDIVHSAIGNNDLWSSSHYASAEARHSHLAWGLLWQAGKCE